MPTVFPDDLLDVVIESDAIRRQALGMAPARAERDATHHGWAEIFFNVLGWFYGSFLRSLPLRWRMPLDLWLCEKMSGHASEANPELPERIRQSVALAKKLRQETGQWPAFFVLTSHPETEGPLAWLRFELLRQGLQIADAVVLAQDALPLKASHPECFLAIDPYALDTVSIPVGAFYAAWMNRVYLAWDRQPQLQSLLQRAFLLKDSGYARVAWRLLDRLRHNVPVLMVLSGGLPHNARLLYTAREFIQSLPLARWPKTKIEAEENFMDLLMEPVNGIRPCENGELPVEALEKLRVYLRTLGMGESELESALGRFAEEFKRPVPYRDRLFNVLRERLVKKGKPVMLIALSHQSTAPHIRISEPCDLGSLTGRFVDGRF